MNLKVLHNNSEIMPVLFLGHGSPMNAIEENQFVDGFRDIAKTLPGPNAILCISAHWYIRGTKVTAMKMPATIHDFSGFPSDMRFNTRHREVLNWQMKWDNY
jgi:4,5-DOPA dioxygenase extradiol